MPGTGVFKPFGKIAWSFVAERASLYKDALFRYRRRNDASNSNGTFYEMGRNGLRNA